MQFLKFLFLGSLLFLIACKTTTTQNSKIHQNHLANESSPYLLQHANNPVDWYPWGTEALEKAKNENKLLLISVGYSACHWCHVMEHESFEDSLVSSVMNEHFVNIKVDREERPDVDDVYMTACHLSSGRSCGWPLNAFALPDGRPIFAGTYFPKSDWLKLLNNIIKTRQENPAQIEQSAQQLTQGIKTSDNISYNPNASNFKQENLDKIAATFLENIDFKDGGRIGAPKFPMPNNYEFLLRYYQLTGDEKALEAVETTLEKMAFGGIYDHVGGGFARYSVDGVWKVPHFEKMLYDNSQLVSLYAQAYQLTKNPLYRQVIMETLAYTAREMTLKAGGFYASLDADSEGEEGKFYVWTMEEIKAVLKEGLIFDLFCDYYEVSKKGNWEHHKNILHRKETIAKIAKRHKMTETEVGKLIHNAKMQLFKAREKRIRPGLDDKVLTSWNALMLKAYVDAYRALGTASYLKAALKNADFLSKNMLQSDHSLLRNYKDGKAVINAFLDDYALLSQAFIALYQVTFDEKWLNEAKALTQYTITHFYDNESKFFNYTSDLDPPLIARKKELADNVIPASNSVMARNLYHLGLYFYDTDMLEKAKQMMSNMEASVSESKQPNFYSNWCQLYTELVSPPYEVAIVGENAAALRKELTQHYLPNTILLGGQTEGALELLKDKLQEGETKIYVCQNKVCKFPVTTVAEALKLIR